MDREEFHKVGLKAPERAQSVTRWYSNVLSTGWAQLSTAGDFRNWCATVDQVLRSFLLQLGIQRDVELSDSAISSRLPRCDWRMFRRFRQCFLRRRRQPMLICAVWHWLYVAPTLLSVYRSPCVQITITQCYTKTQGRRCTRKNGGGRIKAQMSPLP